MENKPKGSKGRGRKVRKSQRVELYRGTKTPKQVVKQIRVGLEGKDRVRSLKREIGRPIDPLKKGCYLDPLHHGP